MNKLELLGRNLPSSITDRVRKLLITAGNKSNPYVYAANMVIATSLLFLLFTLLFLYPPLNGITNKLNEELFPSFGAGKLIIALTLSLFITLTLLSLWLSYYAMKADMRRAALEAILPDFLTMVASNVRSGMNLDQAMWQAAKPEFGILSEEVKEAIKSSFSGEPIDKVLEKLGERFNSPLFKRALNIIRNSLYSGGEIAVVLDKIAEEATQISIIRRDIRSSLVIYVIFLFFASAIGVPFLLAVSLKTLTLLHETFSLAQTTTTSFLSFTLSSPPVSPEEFYYFSILLIIISSIMSAFMIGSTYAGKKTEGIRYLPAIMIIGLLVFFSSLAVLDWIFGFISP